MMVMASFKSLIPLSIYHQIQADLNIINLLPSGSLLLSNYIGRDAVWCRVHKHNHREKRSPE
jgi:hypothetical protein